jgi:hypothetical protein
MRSIADRRGSRGGYTLVESLVVISINSALLVTALVLFGTLLKGERHGRRHCEQTRAVMRLADDLRRDAAAAGRAECDAAGNKLRLQLPDDRTVEFIREDDRIRRLELAGPSVVRREAYQVAELSGAKFLVSADKLVSIELKADETHEPWHIDARLAGDRRFAPTEDMP